MIADTTFLIHIIKERRAGQVGPARAFLAQHRTGIVRTTIISLAEVAVSFASSDAAWQYFNQWNVYRLHDGVAKAAADLDREVRRSGQRLGENDNWIAGFCRYTASRSLASTKLSSGFHGCAVSFIKMPGPANAPADRWLSG